MSNIVWEKTLSVGNLVIDSGHQNLIGMINSLEYAIHHADSTELLRVFKRFCDFASLHFKDEEKIMQAVKFPFVPHRLEHQYLLDDLQHTINKLVVRNDSLLEYAHYPEFLRAWFIRHINDGATELKPALQDYPYDFIPD